MARLILILTILALAGCQPSLTYEEMSNAYAVAADPAEKAELLERIEQFEETSQKADRYYSEMTTCNAGGYDGYVVYCRDAKLKGTSDDIDRKVRNYRRDSKNCGCTDRQRLINQLSREMR